MKKLVFILMVAASPFINAQTERGNFLLGPSVNFSQGKTNNKNENFPDQTNKSNSQNFNGILRLGYFLADNIVAGVVVGYNNSVNKTFQNYGNPATVNKSEAMQNLVTMGLFGRGYKLFKENKFGCFIELQGAYSVGEAKGSNTTDVYGTPTTSKNNSDVTGLNVGFRLGVVYFITKKIGLEASFGNLGYSYQKNVNYTEGQKNLTLSSNNVNFNLGANTLYLGANFYFGGKKKQSAP